MLDLAVLSIGKIMEEASMKYIFFDSCVLLSFLQNHKVEPMLSNTIDILDKEIARLLVPDQLRLEIDRNKERIIESRKAAIRTYRKHASNLKTLLDDSQITSLDKILAAVDQNIPNWDGKSDYLLGKLEKILNHKNALKIKTIDQDILLASKRALEKKAPFIKNKNSFGDALLIESILRFQRETAVESIYFVTLNTEDFSDTSERLKVHPDLSEIFEEMKIHYSINPPEIIEHLLSIKIPPVIKEIYATDIGPMIQMYSDEFPDLCIRCGGNLVNSGYKVMFGSAGQTACCINCGTFHMSLDPNY